MTSSRIEKNKTRFIGTEFETNNYGKCVVVGYEGATSVFVMFSYPKCLVKTTLLHLKRGAVANPMKPSVQGVGFIGVGRYSSLNKREYTLWSAMLRRVIDCGNNLSYKDVCIEKEWSNFQNFAEWCSGQTFLNSEDDKGKKYHLDKDILIKGSRSYSPDTCCFVPQEINALVISNRNRRGSLPVGVIYCKRDRKYIAQLRDGSTTRVPRNLGYFNTPEEAFSAYKEAKEFHIKAVAEKWKGRVDEKVYKALINWEVHIND